EGLALSRRGRGTGALSARARLAPSLRPDLPLLRPLHRRDRGTTLAPREQHARATREVVDEPRVAPVVRALEPARDLGGPHPGHLEGEERPEERRVGNERRTRG